MLAPRGHEKSLTSCASTIQTPSAITSTRTSAPNRFPSMYWIRSSTVGVLTSVSM